VKMN